MENLFLAIVRMGVIASIPALVLIAFRPFLRKIPRTLTCVLWSIVAIRLVIPDFVESPFSLIPPKRTVSVKVEKPVVTGSGETFLLPSSEDGSDSSVLDVSVTEFSPDDQTSEKTVSAVIMSFPAEIHESMYIDSLMPEQPISSYETVTKVVSVLWLIGVLGMLLYACVSYLRIRRKVREAVLLKDNIWLCDHVTSPFLFGVFRPRILLPSSIEPAQMQYIVAHEQAHLKRRDSLWKLLGFLLLSVYWFHPALWVAYFLFCRDIELACDERAIKTMGAKDVKEYSVTLLNYSVSRRGFLVYPLAFGGGNVKRRIQNVLHYKKPSLYIISVFVVICVVAGVCFLTNPKSGKKEENLPAGSEKLTGQVATSLLDKPLESSVDTEEIRKDVFAGMTPMTRSLVWLNYFYNREIQPNAELVLNLPEFPGVTFRATSDTLTAETEDSTVTLISDGIFWTAYVSDLNKDKYPDFCITVSAKEDITKQSVMVYDYANKKSYVLQDDERYNYALDGEYDYMYVVKSDRTGQVDATIGSLILASDSADAGNSLQMKEAGPGNRIDIPYVSGKYRGLTCLDLIGYSSMYGALCHTQENRWSSDRLFPDVRTVKEWEDFASSYGNVLVWSEGKVTNLTSAYQEVMDIVKEYTVGEEEYWRFGATLMSQKFLFSADEIHGRKNIPW